MKKKKESKNVRPYLKKFKIAKLDKPQLIFGGGGKTEVVMLCGHTGG